MILLDYILKLINISVDYIRCQNDSSIICWKGTSPIVHPIMAPMITSKNFFKFRYGKLQIRAKMPSGDWIEPSIFFII